MVGVPDAGPSEPSPSAQSSARRSSRWKVPSALLSIRSAPAKSQAERVITKMLSWSGVCRIRVDSCLLHSSLLRSRSIGVTEGAIPCLVNWRAVLP